MFRRSTRTAKPARTVLKLESLESREVPAILIQLDYSRDVTGFFNNSEARATLEQVASELGNALNGGLAAIAPSGSNTWTATFFDPATGGQMSVSNMSIRADTIKLYVGARSMSGAEAGFGGFGGYSISGTQAWLSAVQTRGHSGFSPWGGSIAFDTNINWHFGRSTDGLTSSKLDFYSVAAHELGHVLGLGTAPQWRNLVSGGAFRGGSAMGVYGGPVPVGPNGDHWADGIKVNGQAVSLDPSLSYGQRVGFTSLDFAALNDLGWANGASGSSGSSSSGSSGVTLVPVAGTDGTIRQVAVINGAVVPTGAVFNPFPGYRGPLHQAYADFDRDGTMDVAVATVGGPYSLVAVVSGKDGSYIGAPRVALGGVAGMLAADIDGDGTPELITVEGQPWGIYVFDVAGGAVTPDVKFAAFGSPGRAALTASGELDRTGYGDTISEYMAEERARLDTAASSAAAYTVSADPMNQKPCACGACRVLAQMADAGDEPNAPAWQDDLMSTVRVA